MLVARESDIYAIRDGVIFAAHWNADKMAAERRSKLHAILPNVLIFPRTWYFYDGKTKKELEYM